ncbi:MAG: M48 family metalloprotease, partial [Planctomycetaceae bacterium]|nr:M48 family metalloprotease [Planctomycetaceae bacterium]
MNQYLNSLSMSNALRNLGENWADLPPVADALLRISIVLILAWLVHAILLKCHFAWRVLLWRGVAVGLLLLPLPGLLIPRLVITLPAQPHLAGATAVELPSSDPIDSQQSHGFGTGIKESSVKTHPSQTTSATIPAPDTIASTNSTTSRSLFPLPSLLALLKYLPVTLFTLWGVGVLLLSLRWLRAQWEVRKLVSTCRTAPENSLRILREIEHQNAVTGSVKLMVSPDQEIPFAAGIRRGVIVVPERLCADDQAEELRGVLAHELSHHLSGDLRWMGMLQGLEIL